MSRAELATLVMRLRGSIKDRCAQYDNCKSATGGVFLDRSEAFSFERDLSTLLLCEAPARQGVYVNAHLARTVHIKDAYIKITALPLEGNKGMYIIFDYCAEFDFYYIITAL